MNDRAIVYRRKYNIPSEWGTAVNVQAMVYGNTGENSGSGVAFTRDPANGRRSLLRRIPHQRAGRRRRRRRAHARAGRRAQEADAQGLRRADESPRRSSRSISRTCRTSSSPSRTASSSCSRRATASAPASPRVSFAVDMVKEKLIDWKTAITARSRPISSTSSSRRSSIAPRSRRRKAIATGLPAGPGAATGKIYFNADRAAAAAEKGEKVLLVRNETSPEDLRGMIAAEGILTAKGGVSSHAALVARQMGKVCVCGAAALHIDYKPKTVTVARPDLQRRRLPLHRRHHRHRLCRRVTTAPSRDHSRACSTATRPRRRAETYQELRPAHEAGARKATRLQVRTNADNPEQTRNAVAFGATGIGLTPHRAHVLRGRPHRRHARDDPRRQRRRPQSRRSPSCCPTSAKTSPASSRRSRAFPPPSACSIRRSTNSCRTIAQPQARRSRRSSASPPRKSPQRVNELHEFNPMLGHRGCRLGIAYPEITEMQARAIFEAAADVAEEGHQGEARSHDPARRFQEGTRSPGRDRPSRRRRKCRRKRK